MTGGIPLLRWAAVALAFLLLSACAAPGGPNLDVAPIAMPDLMPTPEPAATPTSPAFVDATGGHAAPPFHTLAEFREMLGEAVASGSVEPFWQEIVAVGQMPLIFGEDAILLSDYEKLDRLPVIYATDGEEFDDPQMGAKSIILDNLLADGAIQPVLVVFVDPRDPVTGRNRRYTELATNDDYVAFLVEDVENTRRLRDVLQAKGHPLEYRETLAGHSWSNWRSVLGDLLVYFFAK